MALHCSQEHKKSAPRVAGYRLSPPGATASAGGTFVPSLTIIMVTMAVIVTATFVSSGLGHADHRHAGRDSASALRRR